MAVPLRFTIEQIIIGFVGERNKRAGHIFDVDALTVLHRRNFRLRQRALGMVVYAPRPTVFVVDRHPRMCAQWMTRARRNYRIPGYDPRCDAPVIFTAFGI